MAHPGSAYAVSVLYTMVSRKRVVGGNVTGDIRLSPKAEAKVRERARASGKDLGAMVSELLESAVSEPMAEGTFFLLFVWVICWWMYRKRTFINI